MCREKILLSIDRDVLDQLVATGLGDDYVTALTNTIRIAGLAQLVSDGQGVFRIIDAPNERVIAVRAFDTRRRR